MRLATIEESKGGGKKDQNGFLGPGWPLPVLQTERLSLPRLIANDLFASAFRCLELGDFDNAHDLLEELLDRADELPGGLRATAIVARDLLNKQKSSRRHSATGKEFIERCLDRLVDATAESDWVASESTTYQEADAQFHEGLRTFDAGRRDEAFSVFDRLSQLRLPSAPGLVHAAKVMRNILNPDNTPDQAAEKVLELFPGHFTHFKRLDAKPGNSGAA
jgi:hypothetical protein